MQTAVFGKHPLNISEKEKTVVLFLHPHISQSLKHAVSPNSKQG